MATITLEVEIAPIAPRVKAPTRPAPRPRQPRPRGKKTTLACVHLSDAERAALNRAAAHFGLDSRADAMRNGIRITIEALAAGAVLPRRTWAAGVRRSGEGVSVPNADLDALDAAAVKADISLSAAIRWGCRQLIDAYQSEILIDAYQAETSNGAH